MGMTAAIDMGVGNGGGRSTLDLEELLATRLLVQGNSGSGNRICCAACSNSPPAGCSR